MTVNAVRAVRATRELVNAIPLLGNSDSEDDYREALELVEYLIKGDDTSPLISFLASRIAEHEGNNEKFAEFDKAVATMPVSVASLRTLINQHSLTYVDLKNEIDSKSLVSQISPGQQSLTIPHIKVLSTRFGVKPEWLLWLMTDTKLPDALRLSGFERAQILGPVRPCLLFRLLLLPLLIYQ